MSVQIITNNIVRPYIGTLRAVWQHTLAASKVGKWASKVVAQIGAKPAGKVGLVLQAKLVITN